MAIPYDSENLPVVPAPDIPRFGPDEVLAPEDEIMLVQSSTQGLRLGTVGAFLALIKGQAPTGTPPTVALAIAAPTLAAGASTTLTATAVSVSSTIVKVEFFDGGQSVGSTANQPYQIAYTPASAGQHTLVAVATDAAGRSATSAAKQIVVTSPTTAYPKVTLAPVASAQLGAALNLLATASVQGDLITKVEFFDGGTKIGEATSTPYAMSYAPNSVGQHQLTAKATTAQGLSAISAPINVQITAGANKPPTVSLSLSSPSATQGDTVTLTAQASDVDDSVAKVEFFDGSTLLGTVTSPPYTFAFVTSASTATGGHTMRAVATDTKGDTNVATQPLSVSAAAPATTTPNAPAVAFSALTRYLTATHPLGTAQIEYSHDNGATYVAYASVKVDDTQHEIGEWLFRTKAAANRNPSSTAQSPFISSAVAPITLTKIDPIGPDSVSEGASGTYVARGTYSDGSTRTVTDGTWGANTPGGVLSPASNATRGDSTTATVTYTSGSIKGEKVVNITDATAAPVQVNPSYYGTLTTHDATPQQLAGLTSQTWDKQSRTVTFDVSANTGLYCYFAEPASYGVRASITDPDGENLTNSIDRTTATINGVSCNVYVTQLPQYGSAPVTINFAF